MEYEPTLRLRRRQPRLLGNVLAIAIIAVWAFTFVAWGVMPGPTEPDVGVTIPPHVRPCDATVPPDPNC